MSYMSQMQYGFKFFEMLNLKKIKLNVAQADNCLVVLMHLCYETDNSEMEMFTNTTTKQILLLVGYSNLFYA